MAAKLFPDFDVHFAVKHKQFLGRAFDLTATLRIMIKVRVTPSKVFIQRVEMDCAIKVPEVLGLGIEYSVNVPGEKILLPINGNNYFFAEKFLRKEISNTLLFVGRPFYIIRQYCDS